MPNKLMNYRSVFGETFGYESKTKNPSVWYLNQVGYQKNIMVLKYIYIAKFNILAFDGDHINNKKL